MEWIRPKMTETIKRGAGIQEGFEFQYWYGVKLIIDWKISPPGDLTNPPWLEEEIDNNKFGIFDDILMYKDSNYYFYQAKKAFSTMGGIINENDLLDDESNLSILKMYSSYQNIKKMYPNENFYLINVSNKAISGILREIIIPNKNRIEEPFIKNSIKKIEKKKLRNAIAEKCSGNDLEDFLKRIRIFHFENPEYDVKHRPIVPLNIIQNLYNWVRKIAQKKFINSENKISYGDFQFLLNIDKSDIPLRLGFYSKSEFPSDILYDYSIDFFSQINGALKEIDWNIFRNQVEKLRKTIIARNQNRLIRIEALTHLTLGYIIGFVFRSTTGFNLQVLQRFIDLEEVWKFKSKNQNLNEENIQINTEVSNENSKNLIICLEFTEKPVINFAKEYLVNNNIDYKQITEIIFRPPITANQVTPLINTIIKLMVKVEGINMIHLFNAIPLALAILLGFNFNAMPTIQLYEFNMAERNYIPSYILNQKISR